MAWPRRRRSASAVPDGWYGDGGTIHDTTWLDVEIGDDGTVEAVWFRCRTLPFRVFHRGDIATGRTRESDLSLGEIRGVVIFDTALDPLLSHTQGG